MNDDTFDDTLADIEALPSETSSLLYVLYAEGTKWIKIGYATEVEARIQQLQTGCPVPLRLLFAVPIVDPRTAEEFLHTQFASYHSQGEWFTLPEDVPTVLAMLATCYRQGDTTLSYPGPSTRIKKLTIEEERIVVVLAQQPLSIRAIMEAIEATPAQYGYMRKLLTRLYTEGKVGKVRHGLYCAKEYKNEGLI